MNIKQIILTSLIAASTFGLTSCDKLLDKLIQTAIDGAVNHEYQDSEEWGKVVTRTTGIGEIRKADITGAVRLVYTQDSIARVQVRGNEKAIDAYSIEEDGGELVVSLNDFSGKINDDTPCITVMMSSPAITKLDASGACEFVCTDSVSQSMPLYITLSGAGKVILGHFQATSLDMRLSGAGKVHMTEVDCSGDVKLNISGAADVLGRLKSRYFRLNISGAGNAELDVDCQKLRGNCSGAATMTLSGKCQHVDLHDSGACKINTDSLLIMNDVR